MGRLHSTAKLSAVAATLGALAALTACDESVVIGGGTGGAANAAGATAGVAVGATSTGSGITTPPAKVDKIDILVSIDNSRSMADKQAVLSLALSDLVQSLTNPACVDGQGVPVAAQPTGSFDPCPAGSVREFTPILDIHVGVITSSLGGHGSDACPTPAPGGACSDAVNPSNNDAAHLITRQTVCGGTSFPTYQNSGFLAWDPAHKLTPTGEADATAFTSAFRDIVGGVGQIGCGYESQMESWYRFLVDPEPYQSISIVNGVATPQGTDALLLQQRAAFLRPDSLLAILMLSDENDCSVNESGQFYLVAQSHTAQGIQFTMPRARQECATNPNDPCCKSCGQQAPAECPTDPACSTSPKLDPKTEDTPNLRCWDQKRRFGIDFLYPVDRYTNALTASTVPNRQGDIVPNPIFSKLNPNDPSTTLRDRSLVVIAGIVGVPWQDIARDPGDLTKGFKSAEELSQPVAGGSGNTWDKILGDPSQYVPPTDAHMVESMLPRPGLAAPGSAPGADPINGHEYTVVNKDDLQYACIFPLATPQDDSPMGLVGDCSNPANDSPLCDPANPTTQIAAKAYPGQRELSVLKSVGAQGVVASICPSQTADNTRSDYAYRPAVASLFARVKGRLKL